MGLDTGPGLDTGFEYSPIPSMEEPFTFGWDPDPLPQLDTVMPADDWYESGSFLTGGPGPADDMPAGFGPGPGFDPGLESPFQVVEPSALDWGWDVITSPEVTPARDYLINKYLLKPETEVVNTAGRTETNVNPRYAEPRGSVPIGSIPQQTVFFPWQQPGDIGDAPQGPGLGISPGVLLIGGLVLFLLTR